MPECDNIGKKIVTHIALSALVGVTITLSQGCRFMNTSVKTRDYVSLTIHKGLSPTHEKTLRVKMFECQREVFGSHVKEREDEGFGQEVSFFVVIENKTDCDLHIGSEAYSIGYYSLELDFEVDGRIHTSKKKDSVDYVDAEKK